MYVKAAFAFVLSTESAELNGVRDLDNYIYHKQNVLHRLFSPLALICSFSLSRIIIELKNAVNKGISRDKPAIGSLYSALAPSPPLLLYFSFVFACCLNKTLLYSDRLLSSVVGLSAICYEVELLLSQLSLFESFNETEKKQMLIGY